MQDFADRLEQTGELVGVEGLAPEGTWVRYDGPGRPPVTDGPFAETKDLIAGWMIVDVDGYDRALELAGELSAAPGAAGGRSMSGSRSGRSWRLPRRSPNRHPGRWISWTRGGCAT